MSTLKVAIAGYGVVGRRRHQVINNHPDLTAVAVCDRTFNTEFSTENGVRRYQTADVMIRQEKPDILFVCLTNDVAADVTIAGLQAGAHVFCEKPPGRDVGDIRRVIAEESKNPALKLKYGFNHRYHDSVMDALALARSGQMGALVNMRGVYGKSKIINFGCADWRSQRAIAGGGILLDQGIHLVDLMRLFGGEFDQVHSIVTNTHWGHDVEDNAYALMRGPTGVVAMLHSSATEWRHRFRLEMAFTQGSITLSGLLTSSKSYGAETITVARKSEDDSGDPLEQTTRYNRDPSWENEVNEFAAAILENRPIENGSSRDALHTMELVYRIYCADPDWKAKWSIPSPVSHQV